MLKQSLLNPFEASNMFVTSFSGNWTHQAPRVLNKMHLEGEKVSILQDLSCNCN